MRALVVVNPAAGRGSARRLLPEVTRALSRLGIEHDVHLSRGPEEPAEVSRASAGAGDDVVIALGGDGLVSACVGALAGTQTSLAIVPGGTGNDLAHNLGLDARDPLRALRLLDQPPRSIDVVRITGEGWSGTYACVAGTGFDSEANAYANRLTGVHGTLRYIVAVFRTLIAFEPAIFTVSVDGQARRMRAMMVAVGNASSYGGGMRVTPDARVDDGLLDVCVVGALPKWEFAMTFPKVFRGTHLAHPRVQSMRGTVVEVAADRPFPVYADGEPFGALPARHEVVAGALRVVAP